VELPVFSKPYRLLAYRLCSRFYATLSPYFASQLEAMRPLLKKAKLFMTVEEYFSTALFTALLVFPFVLAIIVLLLTALYELNLIASLLIGFIFAGVAFGAIFFAFFIYPSYIVDSLKHEIEQNLPYATTHMATIAGTGAPIYVVFRMVGDFTEYGEISSEFRKLSRDIEVFGTDTLTAISQAASETPSSHLKELLWGIVSVIRSGGDLRRYLMEKADAFMEAQKNMQEQYIDSLSLLAEMYTTIFVAGPVLFVVMVTIMGSMGSLPMSTDMLLKLVIYLGMPIAAGGFIVLVEGSKPTGSV
jgi:flagellar protein FlaJ